MSQLADIIADSTWACFINPRKVSVGDAGLNSGPRVIVPELVVGLGSQPGNYMTRIGVFRIMAAG